MTQVLGTHADERVERESTFLRDTIAEVERVVVGQRRVVERLLVGILADGHVLLEGLPGLAKSLMASSLATALGGTFRRIQFTPDLLPGDLLGTHVLDPRTGAWGVREGPIFANVVLADEINRAPAKVQSALLEAMEERQVSWVGETRALPQPFLVLATQNPVELEGTYPLPEAQVDRFLLKVQVAYPAREDEILMLERMAGASTRPVARPCATPDDVLAARRLVEEIFVDPKLRAYIVDVVRATREPAAAGLPGLASRILYGASPRASLALVRAARAHAFLAGRGHATPHDVKSVGPDVLRHRVMTTYEAEAEGLSAEDVVARVFDAVPVP